MCVLVFVCVFLQGEHGEPGQKGSKGDKGEGVSGKMEDSTSMSVLVLEQLPIVCLFSGTTRPDWTSRTSR